MRRVRDGVYRIRLKVVDPRTGKKREMDRLIEGVASPVDAVRLREVMRDAVLRGEERVEEERASITLGEFARSWMRGKLPALKPSTARTYAMVLDLHVLPILGDRYVDSLTHRDIVRWRDAQRGAPATVNCRLRVLRTLLRDAAAELGLARDPVARVPAIRQRMGGQDPRSLTAEELARLLSALRQVAPRWFPIFATLAMTGMRFGEVSALRWEDLDDEAGVIHIRRSQWRGRVDSTKTGVIRLVPLPAELARVLAEHRRRLFEAQAPGFAEGWMFPSTVGTLLHQSSLRKPLDAGLAAAKIGRRFSVHGFRHTFNNLVRKVASGEVARSMTGHVTTEMTEHYSHVGVDEKRAAVTRALASVLGGSGDEGGDSSDAN